MHNLSSVSFYVFHILNHACTAMSNLGSYSQLGRLLLLYILQSHFNAFFSMKNFDFDNILARIMINPQGVLVDNGHGCVFWNGA